MTAGVDPSRTPPAEILAVLSLLCPEVACDIEQNWNAAVSDYARHLWRPVARPASGPAIAARSIVREVLHQRLGVIMQPEQIGKALEEFEHRPVVQSGLHCLLLMDRITFDALLLAWLGAVENGLSAFICFMGTTMTMETIGREGPGWLDVGDDKVNLFGMARHKLCRKSACVAGPVALNRRALEAVGDETDTSRWLGTLLASQDRVFGTAADALTALNEDLVARWDCSGTALPVFIDDRLAAAAMARHLEYEGSLLSRLLFEPARRQRLEHALQEAASSPFGRFLPNSTAYFWGIREERVRKLVLENGRLIEPDRPHGLSVPFERTHLKQGLLDGVLLPNLFLMFLVLAILPRVRVVGGLRQIGYMALFHSILLAGLDENAPDERDLIAELQVRESAWGMRVIDEKISVREQLAGLPERAVFPELLRQYRLRTFAETTDDLRLVREDARWRKLGRAEIKAT
ncbi:MULTISPECIES: hypothetical protein [unclassified Mesorhizobium]|uniref:hypothetical protein n=1 Tax=unclassified Mesorhizobium TaxID=325217 RepID=UPI000BAF681C|nr:MULTISPECIES: hypothetical protein [unclassified Mesorhizobium]TGT63460.1 hypothetical protein EN813_008680 [Mesorhizobium sp. M00.F.Ca.ET.170.01.1.1]AZO11453.1 hypothetical protein EJ074_21895 [Mesorhizobium sp. M3A.F.Ca.ET.080.04.2.1]PBB88283.1 hypothetical protein CK216_00610 [Mesorhizobium sp. WSM3876]RWB76774.1 MAG: hypothetical protein EOQ49_02910 [Mesorhizobium sp.]RWF25826.1 MAG: hypothetical protein EOS64_03325 [Mesorhizobium sp.]